MTLLHTCHDELHSRPGEIRFSVATVIARLTQVLKTFHRAIVMAKMRRLRQELMFRAGHGDDASPDRGAARFPQMPLVLGDKWDF